MNTWITKDVQVRQLRESLQSASALNLDYMTYGEVWPSVTVG